MEKKKTHRSNQHKDLTDSPDAGQGGVKDSLSDDAEEQNGRTDAPAATTAKNEISEAPGEDTPEIPSASLNVRVESEAEEQQAPSLP